MSSDFTPEQKRYLEGFVAGIQARGGTAFVSPGNAPQAAPEPKPMGPDAPHLIAHDETIKAGKNSPIRRNGSAKSILSTPITSSVVRPRATKRLSCQS
jgi:hypothetical protein